MAPAKPNRRACRRPAAILAAALTAAAFAAPAAAEVFNPEMFTLDNGLRVVLIENQAMPAVGHIIYYGVGSADETIGQSGLAHLFEHLQFKGTPTYPDGAFSDFVALVGGSENAFTTWDYTAYYQIVAPEHLARVMEMEADRMTNTVLTPEVINTERQVVFEEFATRIGNEPSSWLNVEVRSALFTHHPYGVPIIGYMNELAAVSHEDIIAFHRTWYAPGNAVVLVSGPVTLEELRPLAEETYGRIPAAETPVRKRPDEPEHYAPRRVTLAHPQLGQASWSKSYLAPSYTAGASEHAYALQVLSEIIGSGTDSRFYQRLVLDQGVAIGAGAGYNPDPMDLGTFVLWGTPPVTGDDEAAIAAIEAAIEAEIALLLEEGVTQEEVDSAISQLQASAIFAQDSLMAGANIIGQALITGRSIEDVESWPERIAAVTAEQVNAAARAVFNDNNSVVGIALPAPAM